MNYQEFHAFMQQEPEGLVEMTFHSPIGKITIAPLYRWENPVTREITKAVVYVVKYSDKQVEIVLDNPHYIETARNWISVPYGNIASVRAMPRH